MRITSLSRKQTQILSYAYAAAAALAVALHPGVVSFLDFSVPGISGIGASVVTWAFLLGCALGAFGVAMQRWWGFAGLYLATAVGTFGLAICMVPLIIVAFPAEARAVPLLVLNAAFLLGLVLLHVAIWRQNRIAA